LTSVSQLASISKQIERLVDEYYEVKARTAEEFVPGRTRIQYVHPIFDSEEIKEVLASLLDGRLAIGRRNDEFEKRFASFVGTKHCLTTNSGSSALLLIWACLKNWRLKNQRLRSGDEVITAAANHPATVNCLIQNGLTPVLIDDDEETFDMDASLVESAITPRTRGILAMHLLGNPCEMDRLEEIANDHDLYLVEDCCDAHGAEHQGRQVGSIGELAAFSFYAAHQMTMGEGGTVTFQDEVFDEILRSLRGWGVTDVPSTSSERFATLDPRLPNYDRRHLFMDMAYNLKIIEFQAAFGLKQLDKLKTFVEKRRQNWNYLFQRLKDYEDYVHLQRPTHDSKMSPYGLAMTVRPGAPFKRIDLVRWLESHGIETRHLWGGDLRYQPAYREFNFRYVGDLKNTALARDGGFFLGCHPGMKKEMMDYILEVFDSFIEKHKTSGSF
jgi:CDP-6-deoxy-D-xylo-4-hexulose-3-dehydrase